jgi:hypothetical protein
MSGAFVGASKSPSKLPRYYLETDRPTLNSYMQAAMLATSTIYPRSFSGPNHVVKVI